MWWCLAISIITIPVLIFFDNRQIAEKDLATINNLILAEDSYYDPGGGKGGVPSIKFNFTTTERDFKIVSNEYQCVNNNIILENFKKGDTISIKIDKTDNGKFFKKDWFIKFTMLYGLSKNGREYIPLNCRNQVSAKRTNTGVIGSIVSAILSLFLAVFILKPKTKHQALGQLPVDPIFIVICAWLIVYLLLR